MNLSESKYKIGDYIWLVIKYVYRNFDNNYEDWEWVYRKAKVKGIYLSIDEDEDEEVFSYRTIYGYFENVYKTKEEAKSEAERLNKLEDGARELVLKNGII